MLEDKSIVLIKGIGVDDHQQQSIRDEIAFQQSYTTNRKGQVTILQERVKYQIELVCLSVSLFEILQITNNEINNLIQH